MNELQSLLANAPLGPITIPEGIKSIPAYHRFESTNPAVSDTQHESEWIHQFSSYDRWGVSEEEGCVFTFRGVPTRMVGITRDGEVLGEEEVNLRLEANPNASIPTFRQFSFYIQEINKTNGPAERENLRKTVEQQRAQAERGLTESIASAFAQLATMLSANQAGGVQEALQAILPKEPELHPAQLAAQKVLKEMEEDDRRAALEALQEPVVLDTVLEIEPDDDGELEPAPAVEQDSVQAIVNNLIRSNKKKEQSVVI